MSITFLTLFTTLRCNNSCQHCLYGCNPNTGDDMSWNTFNTAIEIALGHKINTINLFGGEPFLNKNIFKMIEYCLLKNLQIIIATNGKMLSTDNVYDKFIKITKNHKDMIRITIGNDKYHLPFFNPELIGKKLINDGYIIVMPEYTDNTLIITEKNKHKIDISKNMNNGTNCCANGKHNSIGILPNGCWSLCPPSLIEFGNIEKNNLNEIIEFKEKIKLNKGKGCTHCITTISQSRKNFIDN